jgi:hypothetical protein
LRGLTAALKLFKPRIHGLIEKLEAYGLQGGDQFLLLAGATDRRRLSVEAEMLPKPLDLDPRKSALLCNDAAYCASRVQRSDL